MADEMNIGFDFHRFLFPIIIIAVGLLMVFRPSRRRRWQWQDHLPKSNPDVAGNETRKESWQDHYSEDRFDSTSVFSGVKKVIVSKNFRGGDITCFMGGFEADMSKADLQSAAVLDITQIFGGTKLVIPSDWVLKIDVVSIFGAVEDKRQQSPNSDPNKLLILKGTSIFGGIEIKSF